MTWGEIQTELAALTPEELQQPALVFDHNGGELLEVRRFVRGVIPEKGCEGDPGYLVTE